MFNANGICNNKIKQINLATANKAKTYPPHSIPLLYTSIKLERLFYLVTELIFKSQSENKTKKKKSQVVCLFTVLHFRNPSKTPKESWVSSPSSWFVWTYIISSQSISFILMWPPYAMRHILAHVPQQPPTALPTVYCGVVIQALIVVYRIVILTKS